MGQNRSPAPPAGSLLAGLGHILVVGLIGGGRAGDGFMNSREGVAVGGQESQIIAAGDAAVPVVDAVIAGFATGAG